MDKDKKRIKSLELTVARLKQDITSQLSLNVEQAKFNVHVAGNMEAVGRKLFPDTFKKEGLKNKPGGVEIKKESNIVTP